MKRNDVYLLAVLGSMFGSLVLIAFAPVADQATFTMRAWSLLESPFSLGVISTFIAAYAGTWGAQRLAERKADRKELLGEIRGTNASLGLVFTIANTFITMKKQLINPMVGDYETQIAAHREHVARIKRGELASDAPFEIQMELKTLSAPFSPIADLRHMIRERITPDGKAVILLTPLTQSILDLEETILRLNSWIAQVRAIPDENDSLRAAMYMGTPFAPGRTDANYPIIMDALKTQADNCIAFSMLVAQSLEEYGDRLSARYGDGALEIVKASFTKTTKILPDLEEYKPWVQK